MEHFVQKKAIILYGEEFKMKLFSKQKGNLLSWSKCFLQNSMKPIIAHLHSLLFLFAADGALFDKLSCLSNETKNENSSFGA